MPNDKAQITNQVQNSRFKIILTVLLLVISLLFLAIVASHILPILLGKYLQRAGVPFNKGRPDLEEYLEEKTGIPYKEGQPDFEAFKKSLREKLTPLDAALLYQVPWTEYRSQNFPLSLALPETFTVSEIPIFHRMDIRSKKYGIKIQIITYLKDPIQKEGVEKLLKRKVDTIYEGIPDVSYRSADFSRMDLKKLPSGRSVYINNTFDQVSTAEDFTFFPLDIYFSLDRWQFVVSLTDAGKEINQFTQLFIEKVADSVQYHPIPEATFIEYWVKPLVPITAN